ncbi:hypothetical protein HZA43_04355 [Candidatus Peregrinibacteria bacterium]|nr:hypothetical protein [Candidatus Peregrinibacteria bacterium]
MKKKGTKKSSDIGISLRPTKTFFSSLLVVIAVVLVWWGIWHLLDAYLYPFNHLLTSGAAIFVGLLILYLPDKDLKDLL